MPNKARPTFQKRAKERARQQKQRDKAVRRLEAKHEKAQAAPRREQLQADLVGCSSDGVKYSGHATAVSVRANRLRNILGGPVDGVIGPGSTNGVHPLAVAIPMTSTPWSARVATSIRATVPAAPHTTAARPFSGQTRARPAAVSPATAKQAASSKLEAVGNRH